MISDWTLPRRLADSGLNPHQNNPGFWYAQSGSNSFFVTVDDFPATGYNWGIPLGSAFVDDFVSNNGLDVQLFLTAGEHTVIVYLREDGTRLDQLMIE